MNEREQYGGGGEVKTRGDGEGPRLKWNGGAMLASGVE